MGIKNFFKKKNKSDIKDNITLSTSDSLLENKSEIFSENDFERISTEEKTISPIADDITLNTKLELGEKDAKLEELNESEMLEIFSNKKTPEENNYNDEDILSSDEDDYSKDIRDDDLDVLSELNSQSKIKQNKFKKSEVSFKKKVIFSAILMSLGVVCGSGAFYLEELGQEVESDAIRTTLNINYEIKNISSDFKSILLGDHIDENQLSEEWEDIEKDLKKLKNYVYKLNNQEIDVYFKSLEEEVLKFEKVISFSREKNQILIKSNDDMKIINNGIEEIKKIINSIKASYLKNNASSIEHKSLYSIENQLYKINNSLNELNKNINIEENSNQISNHLEIFKIMLIGLAEGDKNNGIRPIFPDSIDNYNMLATKWNELLPNIENSVKNKDVLLKTNFFKDLNESLIKNIDQQILNMEKRFADGHTHSQMFSYHMLSYVGILLMILSALLFVISYKKETERREKELIEESNKNKSAILKLLNEMSYLQNGDLTHKTTIEEGITSNIADSINSTIDSLAVIVKKIQNSSLLMKDKIKQINQVSEGLLFSTEHQGNSISEVNTSISNMTEAIEQISDKTKNILDMAEKSYQSSLSGVENVQRSMGAMNLIDKNMEETVLLMKKVSDSSVLISEVISVLSDITEETNILALNATVQAAKAGESGRGFKIVADAIHELADKAAEATKRVVSLIATVQADIKSVGVAIEKTTNEVSSGVSLAGNVENSLDKITEISSALESTIKKVSEEVNKNAEIAKQVSQNMESIFSITEETKGSARKTSEAIAEIDNISTELTSSVKSFIVQ